MSIEELSPSTLGASGSKRTREDDTMESARPSQYRAIAEDVPVPDNDLDNDNATIDMEEEDNFMVLKVCHTHKARGGANQGKYDVLQGRASARVSVG